MTVLANNNPSPTCTFAYYMVLIFLHFNEHSRHVSGETWRGRQHVTQSGRQLATSWVTSYSLPWNRPISATPTCVRRHRRLASSHWQVGVMLSDSTRLFTHQYFEAILAYLCSLMMHSVCNSALNIKLLEPLAQGASRFGKLLAPQKSTGPQFFQTT